MKHDRSSRGRPNPPLRSLELHKVMPRGSGAIMLYREEIMGSSCCTCKQRMSAIAEEEKSIPSYAEQRCKTSSYLLQKDAHFFMCFQTGFFWGNAHRPQCRRKWCCITAFKVDSVATGHFCICVHFMIPALSSVSKSEQIIARRSITAHVLPVKTEELQLFESLGPRHVNCSLVS